MHLPWALAFALQLQAPADVLDLANQAWVEETHVEQEAAWLAALEADPADPAARLGLGAISFVSFEYEQAVERLSALADDPSAPTDYRAYAQYLLGATEVFRGDYHAAVVALTEASVTARSAQDSTLTAITLSTRAAPVMRTAGFAAGVAVIDSASNWTHERAPSYPSYLCSRAGIDPTVPNDEIRRAAASAEENGDLRVASRCLFQATIQQINAGLTAEVYVSSPLAIAAARAARDFHGLATALQWIGYYHRVVGNYAAAERHLLEAIEAGEASSNEAAIAWSLINLAAMAGALGNPREGIAHATRATELLEEQGDLWGLATVRGFEGTLWLAVGEREPARTALLEALSAANQVGNVQTAMSVEYGLAELAMQEGQIDEAFQRYETYRSIVVDNGLSGWMNTVAELRASLAITEGDYELADSLDHAYVNLERQSTRLASYLARMSQTRALMSDLDSAFALASKSADVFDSFRGASTDEALRLYALEKETGDRGVATVIASLTAAGRLDEAFLLAERRRGRELFDQMVREDALAFRAVDRTASEVIDLEELQGALGTNTAVISFTASPGEPTTALTVTSAQVRGDVLDDIDTVREQAERFVSAVESGVELPDVAAALSQGLLPPFADLPAEIDRLIVIADDVIHRVPFDLLPISEEEVVVDRFDVSTVPSATIAFHLWEEPPEAGGASVLAVGDPTWGEATADSPVLRGEELSPLPGSGREARTVSRYGQTSTLLTGRDASEQSLREMDLTGFDVIHLATHAFVDEQSASRSAVALAPGGDHDGFLSPTDLAALDLDAKIVTLSACTSGGGRLVRGEGLQGLTAPLLRAGADAVLATRWRVDDALVGRFVDSFYAGLAAGKTATEALGDAKRARRAAGDPASVWSSFMLVGDHRVTVPLVERPNPLRYWWITVPALAVLLSIAFGRFGRTRPATGV